MSSSQNVVGLSSSLSRWSHRLATGTTLHNFVLYGYVSGPRPRAAVVIAGVLSLLFLPYYLYSEASAFFGHSAVLLSNEWKDDGSMDYPNVTICHPLFFSKTNMEGDTLEMNEDDTLFCT